MMAARKAEGLRDGSAVAARLIDGGVAREAMAKMQQESKVGQAGGR